MASSGDSPPRTRTTTAAMVAYDGTEPGVGGPAGLVLLYASCFPTLPPVFVLRDREAVIGREAPAELVVPLPSVSRRHARLSSDERGWLIADLGARNGMIVNGRLVDAARLAEGDVVRVGDAFFKFVEADAEGYLPYRIDGKVLCDAPATPPGVVGGYRLAGLAAALQRIAQSTISVALFGDSGVGKEVFARQIHEWSGRPGAFCALNCAAIPATLLESELFGYRRGAFSGADRDRIGLVRAADRGTLFLDEVGDMPLEAQAKLLRVLQTREVLPLGAMTPEHVDVRVICATHRDLHAMMAQGHFRGDLFARLNEYAVTIPPLRTHKEDVYALCRAFLARHGRPDLELSVAYLTGVLHYEFPYNVRELEALIKRGVALCDGPTLGPEHLSAEIHAVMRAYGRRDGAAAARLAFTEAVATGGAARPRFEVDDEATGSADSARALGEVSGLDPWGRGAPQPSADELRQALTRHHGNVAAVGREFGKERMQIHRWMKRLGIDPNDFR